MKKTFLLLALALGTFSIVSAQEVGQEGFVGPGGCTTKEECRAYCDIDGNKEECLTFAVEKGMMTQEEADKARKFLNQTGPGGCRGDECKDYCEDPANTEECIRFAEENGLIKPGEGARFRKLREISQKGGPGGCKGEDCQEYCEDEAHRDECFAFAREHGILSQEQLEGYETGRKIEQAIKEAGGPGGCRSERECHEYCSDSARIDECAAFGAKHTGKSPEEMRKMLEEFKSGNFRNGPEGFERDREEFERRRQEFEGRIRESGDIRERMMRDLPAGRQEGYRGPSEVPESFEGTRESFQGPGGCNSPESCQQYCMNNPQACGYGQGPREGQMMSPSGSMPQSSEFQSQPAPVEYNREYQQNYQIPEQYQNPPTSEPTYVTPPSEPQPQPQPTIPTSYDHSKSFIANVISAFLAPFRD